MKLETERLSLREIQPSDLDAIHEYASDPEVVKYMSFGPNTIEDSIDFLNRAISRQKEESRRIYTLAVILKETNKVIGSSGLHIISSIQAEIGYVFIKKYWGNGYATETAKALVNCGFNEFGLHRVFATCDPDNSVSVRVLEKVGMKLEGRLRENTLRQGKHRDSLILGILKQEWIDHS
jgi:RimJ/RimL family protein N-acetyltransferase